MKWIHIDENQFEINKEDVVKAFIESEIPAKEAESIANEIACGHGYSIEGHDSDITEQLAKRLLSAGINLKTE